MLQTAKTRLEKVTAAAHARNKATFDPETAAASAPKPKAKARLPESSSVGLSTRTSSRKHTVLNTSATVTRLKEIQQKRVSFMLFVIPRC